MRQTVGISSGHHSGKGEGFVGDLSPNPGATFGPAKGTPARPAPYHEGQVMDVAAQAQDFKRFLENYFQKSSMEDGSESIDIDHDTIQEITQQYSVFVEGKRQRV